MSNGIENRNNHQNLIDFCNDMCKEYINTLIIFHQNKTLKRKSSLLLRMFLFRDLYHQIMSYQARLKVVEYDLDHRSVD